MPKKCPSCDQYVVNLPRHFRTKRHDWSHESAVAAVGQFGQRKQRKRKAPADPEASKDKKKHKDYHRFRICPLPDCMKVVKLLSVHLASTHKFPKDQRYYQLLNEAKFYNPSLLPESIVSSPRKKFGVLTETSRKRSFAAKETIKLDAKKIKNDVINLDIKKSSCSPEMPTYSTVDAGAENKTEKDFVDSENSEEIASDRSSENNDPTYIPEISNMDLRSDAAVQFSEEIEGIFERFFIFLTGPDRGRLSRSVEKVVSDVRRITSAVNATHSLKSLFNPDILRNVYLLKYCPERKIKPGSIKKYLYSYLDFCSFIITEQIHVSDLSYESIIRTKLKVEMWRKSYGEKDKALSWAREEKDYEMLITPEQVEKYNSSESAKLATDMFQKLNSESIQVTQSEYCCLRDHLYTVVHFGNGHRSGVSANLQLKEFRSAKLVDKRWQIKVWDHKTVKTYGPAIITLCANEYNWLKLFVENVRTQLQCHVDNVFLSWTSLEISANVYILCGARLVFSLMLLPKIYLAILYENRHRRVYEKVSVVLPSYKCRQT